MNRTLTRQARFRRIPPVFAVFVCLCILPGITIAEVRSNCEPEPVAAAPEMSCHETETPPSPPRGASHCAAVIDVSDCCCVANAPAEPANRPSASVTVAGPQVAVPLPQVADADIHWVPVKSAYVGATVEFPPHAPLFISHRSLLI